MGTQVTINIYWQAKEGETVGEKIDEILSGLENLEQKEEVTEEVAWGTAEAYEQGCCDADTTWGYDPDMDDDYADTEINWDQDARSELQQALDDLDIARQMLEGNDYITPEFGLLYKNLMRDVIRRVYSRVEVFKEKIEREGVIYGE